MITDKFLKQATKRIEKVILSRYKGVSRVEVFPQDFKQSLEELKHGIWKATFAVNIISLDYHVYKCQTIVTYTASNDSWNIR